jgi:glutamate carboxypeptidase
MPDGSVAGARPGSANFVHVVRGKAAHAGRELDEGRNAILAAARLAQEIDALNHHPDVLANPGRIHGGSAVNVVPDLAVLRSNVRPRTDAAAAYVTDALAEAIAAIAIDGIRITQHGGISRPPKELNDRYRTLLDAVSATGRALGMEVAWRDTGGVCDGNNLAGAGLVNVDNLGPVGGDLHRTTEYLDVSSIPARAKLGAALIVGFDQGRL